MPISAPKIPEGLPELMRGLAKSVIKENPENLYVHAAEYFENLIRERDDELERGYQTFNAYEAYADYREKSREKTGLSKPEGSHVSDGGDGDESGSGESGSLQRGRRRARRRSKQSSREKENPPTMVERPPNGNGGVPPMEASLSEESAPVSVVEQEVVKVRYNPPEGPPSARVVSAQSAKAEQAVSNVLDDDLILDSDDTVGGKETGDELVDNGDEVSTAPSTAEMTQPRPEDPINVKKNDAMALQDMETCFMHANVDVLLEKHLTAVGNDSEVGGANTSSAVEGDHIPEGPQVVQDFSKTLVEPEQPKHDALEPNEKEEVKEMQPTDGGKVPESVSGEETVHENKATSIPTGPTALDEMVEKANQTAENMTRSNFSNKVADIVGEHLVDNTKQVDSRSRPQSAEKLLIVQTIMADSEKPVSTEVLAEKADNIDLPWNEAVLEKSNQEEASTISSLQDASDNVVDESSVAKVATDGILAEDSATDSKQIVDAVNITSRMGFDEDEAEDETKPNVETRSSAGENTPGDEAEKEEKDISAQTFKENASMSDGNKNVPSQKTEETNNKEAGNELVGNFNKTDAVEQNDKMLEKGNLLLSDIVQDRFADEPEMVDRELENKKDNLLEKDEVTKKEPVLNDNVLIVPEEEEENEEKKDVVSSPKVQSSEIEHVKETTEELPDVQSPAAGKVYEVVSDSPNSEVKAVIKDEKTASGDHVPIVPALEKVNSKDETGSAALRSPPSDSNDLDDQKIDEAITRDTPEGPGKDSVESANGNVEDLKSSSVEKDDEPGAHSVEQMASNDEPQEGTTSDYRANLSTGNDQLSDDPDGHYETIAKKIPEKVESMEEAVKVGSVEKVSEAEEKDVAVSVVVAEIENTALFSKDKAKGSEESVDDKYADAALEENGKILKQESTKPLDTERDAEQKNVSGSIVGSSPEVFEHGNKKAANSMDTLESVVMDTLSELLAADTEPPKTLSSSTAKHVDEKPIASSKEIGDKEKDAEKPANQLSLENFPHGDGVTAPVTEELKQLGDGVVVKSCLESAEKPGHEPEPPGEKVGPVGEKSDDTVSDPVEQPAKELEDSREGSFQEAIEEPCVKREISPTKSIRSDKDDSVGKQVEEREEIKKVDLSQLSKDSAEALFYSLKKSELENQEPPGPASGTGDSVVAVGSASLESNADDDDKDVVVNEEPPAESNARTKRTFTDNFLDECSITENQPADTVASDGAQQEKLETTYARWSSEAGERTDEFNPMVMVSMRTKQLQDQLHARAAGGEHSEVQAMDETSSRRPPMRRCMTEMTGLQRYDTTMDDDSADARPYDPDYVEEEDQFDGYYIGHIKNKILASSVSVADSDSFDPTRSSEEPVDENNVRTALETIASTDTESTIASQATIQQAGKRTYLRKHSQNTSSNIPYASFGNAAIDKSLDEFIEREEQHKQDEAMAEAATKIQRSYRTHKKRLLRDYHSTMRTFTEDQSAESGDEYATGVIQIKLDQKRADVPAVGDDGEESGSAANSLHHHQALGSSKRPMYSLNIDEHDTVARRMTLTRGVALQRLSTPDDDSGKSASASTDRKPSLGSEPAVTLETVSTSGSGEAPGGRTSSEEKSDVKAAEQYSAPGSASDEGEHNKDCHSASRSSPLQTAPANDRKSECGPLPKGTGRTTVAPLDMQNLLLMARQRTMPVQIDSAVIRVLPKHMRKRISSAGMLHGGGKRK